MTCALCTLAPAQAYAFSVEQFLLTVVSAHPSVVAARSELQAAKNELTGAWQQLLPELQVTAANPATSRGLSPVQPKSGVAIEQKLWAGGKLGASLDAAETAQKLAQIKFNEARLNIALAVIESLQAYRAAAERQRINQDTAQRLSEFENMMVRRVEKGVSAAIDVSLVRSRMLQAQVDRANAEVATRLALSKLQQLSLGVDFDWSTLSVKDLGPGSGLELPDSPLKAWYLLEGQVELHPTVQRFDTEAQLAQARQRMLSADRFPTVFARVEQNRYENPTNPLHGVTTAFIGMRFTPGAGYATVSQASAAAARASGAAEQAQASRREIANQLRQDMEEWFNARARIKDYASAQKNAFTVSESYERQFVVGRLSWQQTLDAVREYGQIRLSLADTEAALWGASYRLRLRSGDYDLTANEEEQ